MRILVSGGAGYIGSHTAVELLARSHDVVVLDNFSNSSPLALVRVAEITGRSVVTACVDIRDCAAVEAVLRKHRIDAVVHLAGLKAVGESCLNPLAYFDTNIVGTIALLRAMRKAAVNLVVFSSSATVYGEPEHSPIAEDAPRFATSPYGRSKIVGEDVIEDVCASHPEFRAAILRYFNPVGAHSSGLIGEDPRGTPGNIMPYLCQVAAGQRAELPIFGDDYPTPDGTGVRESSRRGRTGLPNSPGAAGIWPRTDRIRKSERIGTAWRRTLDPHTFSETWARTRQPRRKPFY